MLRQQDNQVGDKRTQVEGGFIRRPTEEFCWNSVSHPKIRRQRHRGSCYGTLAMLKVKKVGGVLLKRNDSEKHGGHYGSWAFKENWKVEERH